MAGACPCRNPRRRRRRRGSRGRIGGVTRYRCRRLWHTWLGAALVGRPHRPSRRRPDTRCAGSDAGGGQVPSQR